MNVLILKKNGKSAKIVKDNECNLLDLYKLIADLKKVDATNGEYTIVCVDVDIAATKVIKSNFELGLNGDGSTRMSKETSDVIAKAMDRAGIASIDFNDDSEFKTRAKILKINKMS